MNFSLGTKSLNAICYRVPALMKCVQNTRHSPQFKLLGLMKVKFPEYAAHSNTTLF